MPLSVIAELSEMPALNLWCASFPPQNLERQSQDGSLLEACPVGAGII